MKNKTDILGISVLDRTRQLARNNTAILEFAVVALMGFIMSNSFIFRNIAPFGVAFCAAAIAASAGKELLLPASVGTILGYIFSLNDSMNMRYIGAIGLLLGIYWLFSAGRFFVQQHAPPHLVPFFAFGSVFITSAAASTLSGLSLYDGIMAFAEGILAAGAAYFFSRTLKLYERRNHLMEMETSDLSCVIITFGIMVVALAGFEVAGLSIGRILSVLVILLCSRYAGEMAGAVAGITAGVAMGLMGESYAFLTGAYGVGGLLSGLFSAFGKLGCAAAFVITNGIAVFFSSAGDGNFFLYNTLYEVFAATVIFMLIPAKTARAVAFFTRRYTRKDSDSVKNVILSKMSFASSALSDIAQTTQKVTDKLAAVEGGDDISEIYAGTAQKICRNCGLNLYCWQTAYSDTIEAFEDLHRTLKERGEIPKDKVPKHLYTRCCKLHDFLESARSDYTAHETRLGAQRMVSQVRSVVTDQFDGMAILLQDMAEELGEISQGDRRLSEKIKELFQLNRLEVRSVSCFEDINGRMIAEVTIPSYKLNRAKTTDLTLSMSEMCEREFAQPILTQTERESRLRFVEKATYEVDMGAYQLGIRNSKICGDTYETFVDQNMKAVLMVSDGMGSGPKAAMDSAMATGLLSRLIAAGIGFTAALKMVNSALLVKSGEESLATIDITCIDLYTGKAEFLKAGAAPTFIRKAGRVGSVESTSLPAGILRGVAFESTSVMLSEGDMIVMVSDGIILHGSEWLTSELAHYQGDDPDKLAELLVNTAKARMIDGHEDDITVVVAMIHKGV